MNELKKSILLIFKNGGSRWITCIGTCVLPKCLFDLVNRIPMKKINVQRGLTQIQYVNNTLMIG